MARFVQANTSHLLALKDEAYSFIRETAAAYPRERVVLSFSGGKDSTVTADLVIRALGDPSLVHIFGNTTLEFPQTLEYVSRYRQSHPLAIFKTACNKDQDFTQVCQEIGPPARMMRWCCSMFKTGPIARVINNLYGEKSILTFYGIRKCESVSRSKYKRLEDDSASMKIRQQHVASPIFFWKDIDIWLYLLAEKLDFNQAYRLGYDRVGCWCCPNNNSRAQSLTRLYFPERSARWRSFLIDFAKSIGKPDPEVYVDSGKWKARQGGNGLAAAASVKIRFTNCTTEDNAKIFRLVRPVDAEFLGLMVPFGRVCPELGRRIINEVIVLDMKTNVPIMSIQPFNYDSGNSHSGNTNTDSTNTGNTDIAFAAQALGSSNSALADGLDYAVKLKVMNVAKPELLLRMAGYQVRKFNACRRCLRCESICRFGAIAITRTGYSIDPARCRRCQVCMQAKYLDGGCLMGKYLKTKEPSNE